MNKPLIQDWMNALLSTTGIQEQPLPLHEPVFQGKEWEYVKECLDTGWVSSAGQYVDKFERMLSDVTGAHAVAVGNGTSALHLSLLLAGVRADDEVLMPSLTFVATANAVSYCSAIPHLVDISWTTMGICPDKLRTHLEKIALVKNGQCINRTTGRTIRALLPVHVLGIPAAITELMQICEEYHLVLLEDAAESLGSFHQGRHTGTFGMLGVLSFNGNKIITTGGGGAILTRDEGLAKKAKHLSTTAKVPHAWEFEHDSAGFNYRMPNLNAALGCAQLEKLDSMIARKKTIHDRYAAAFADMPGARIFSPKADSWNYWLTLLVLDEEYGEWKNELLGQLHEAGLQARPFWKPMHMLPMYEACPRAELEATDSAYRRSIQLPSGVKLETPLPANEVT